MSHEVEMMDRMRAFNPKRGAKLKYIPEEYMECVFKGRSLKVARSFSTLAGWLRNEGISVSSGRDLERRFKSWLKHQRR